MDHEQILGSYNITNEFAENWVEQGGIAELNFDSSGQKSKYAILRELVDGGGADVDITFQDEPDPLGSTNSIVSVLSARGINVDDPAIRGQYLISSNRFNTHAFLRDVHSAATYENLDNSLDYLESSIRERSETLRFMVERDYDRFVKSKSLLDAILDQIHESGFSREKDWGLHNIKSSVDDANSKLAVVMKPVLQNQSREQRLKEALDLIKKNRYLFNLPSLVSKHIKNNDHDSLIRDYRRGKDMKYNEDISTGTPDYILENKKVTDRIWKEVEFIVDDYKKTIWKQLAVTGPDGNFMQIISKLLELGVEDNPIQTWIQSQLLHFSEAINDKFDKLGLKTQLLRMNLAALPPTQDASFIIPLKENYRNNETTALVDSPEAVEMWLTIKRLLDDISASSEKACLFWRSCSEFLDGTRQKNLPTGYQGESEVHLALSSREVEDIRQAGRKMINLFAERIVQYFDSSAPALKLAGYSGSKNLSSNRKPDQHQLQDDSYLFLPPYANALGTVKYLSQILSSLKDSFRVLSKSSISDPASNSLRTVLSKVRERCVGAVCHAWKEDSRKFAYLEDWTVSPDNSNITKIPGYMKTYQLDILSGLQSILFFSGEGEPTDSLVASNPSTRLLNHILSNFLSSNSSMLQSMMDLLATLKDSERLSQVESAHMSLNDLTPQELTNDSKVLLLLSNMSEVRDNVLPRLYSFVELSFKTPTRDVHRALRDTMDKMDNQLFDLYTRKKRQALTEVIRTGIIKGDWTTRHDPNNISPYIYDCLLMLVVVHSKVVEVAENLVGRVIVVLNDHVVKQVLSNLREVEKFSNGGMLQAVADIEFWRAKMTNFITADAQNTIQLVYGALRESSDPRSWDTRTGPRPYVQHILEHASRESQLDFSCFNK